MILANLRERVTTADIELVIELLSRGDPQRRRELARAAAARGIDALLDAASLPELLRAAPRLAPPSAPLFIYVVVRHALRDGGIDDRRLSDYLGALLYEFGMRDRACRISQVDDEEFRYLTDLVAAIATVPGRRGFLLRAHLGNFSLWLAGLFPDHITTREQRWGGPGLGFYEQMGARGFRLAAEHRLALQLGLAETYRRAAQSFGAIRVALNRLSDRLVFPHVNTPGRLLRQVADEFGTRG
jgi:hypothetical protein